ncbi:MAG: hypothetical protein WC346_05065 [Methanogenium sp.]
MDNNIQSKTNNIQSKLKDIGNKNCYTAACAMLMIIVSDGFFVCGLAAINSAIYGDYGSGMQLFTYLKAVVLPISIFGAYQALTIQKM